MKRMLLSVAVAFCGLTSSCSCDPPVVPNEGDGDGDDGGVTSADGGGTGLEGRLRGLALLQRRDGILIEMNLTTGVLRYPFGEVSSRGGVTKLDDQLIVFTQTPVDVADDGRIASLDPDTLAVELFTYSPIEAGEIATDGVTVGIAGGIGSSVHVAPYSFDALLATHPDYAVGSAVTFDDDGLAVATPNGIYRTATSALVGTRHCSGLMWEPESASFLCADAIGQGLFRIDLQGAETVVQALSGGRPLSVALLDDGSYVVTHDDCTVDSTVTLPEELSGPLCPRQVVELGDSLYFGAEPGGLVEITPDGDLRLRLSGAIHGEGIATAGGRLALAGLLPEHVQVVDADGGDLWLTASYRNLTDVALEDDGTLWVSNQEGLYRVTRAGESDLVYAHGDITALARVGDELFFARGPDGVGKVKVSDGATAAAEDVTTTTVERLAACGDSVVMFDEDSDELLALDADGSERVLVPALSDVVGEVTGVGCADAQVLVADAEGRVWGLPDGGHELLLAGELDRAVTRLTSVVE